MIANFLYECDGRSRISSSGSSGSESSHESNRHESVNEEDYVITPMFEANSTSNLAAFRDGNSG